MNTRRRFLHYDNNNNFYDQTQGTCEFRMLIRSKEPTAYIGGTGAQPEQMYLGQQDRRHQPLYTATTTESYYNLHYYYTYIIKLF